MYAFLLFPITILCFLQTYNIFKFSIEEMCIFYFFVHSKQKLRISYNNHIDKVQNWCIRNADASISNVTMNHKYQWQKGQVQKL